MVRRGIRDMAAYAAVFSLLDSLRQLLSCDNRFSGARDHPIVILLNSVKCLGKFLEDNRDVKSDFEVKIRDAVYEAQDIIDSYLTSSSRVEISPSLCQYLFGVTMKLSHLAAETRGFDQQILKSSVWKRSDKIKIQDSYPILGRNEDLDRLKGRLMSGPDGLEVVTIVGVAGMGKTALAHCLLDDPSIREHFDATCCVKISLKYDRRNTLLALLGSTKKRADGLRQNTNDELAKHLYNYLRRKRYIVVLDDVRDVAVWNDLKELFPNYHNGSRILLTTRNVNVAPATPHLLRRVSEENSLALLRAIVFSEKPCPPKLAVIASDITKSCRGLPLALLIVGKLLSCAELTKEYWEIVLSSIRRMPRPTGDYYADLVEALVSLTYRHLPQYLKACLLYMGMFPYEYDISHENLTGQLASEGFLDDTNERLVELVKSVSYLQQLRHRGLVSFCLNSETFPKSCRIDREVVHDFVIRKGREEKFFFIVNEDTNYGSFRQNSDTYNQQRRLCISKYIPFAIKDLVACNYSETSLSNVRALIYSGPEHQYPMASWLDFQLLQKLDALKIRFFTFPIEILKLLQLRYLALSYNGQLPKAVCNLRHLQVLIVLHYLKLNRGGAPSYLPRSIWKLKELTHLEVMGSDLPKPPSNPGLVLLPNLRKLSRVTGRSCTRPILEKLRSLGVLEVQIESSEDDSLSFLSHIRILEGLVSFKCVVTYPDTGLVVCHPAKLIENPRTWSALGILILTGCGFPWEYIQEIAALPGLVMLKLRNCGFTGAVWRVKRHDFANLLYLRLEDMDLEEWTLADGSSFPILKQLIIRHCYKLREIPFQFADRSSLKLLEVIDCSTSAMNSAQEIKEKLSQKNGSVKFDFYSSISLDD